MSDTFYLAIIESYSETDLPFYHRYMNKNARCDIEQHTCCGLAGWYEWMEDEGGVGTSFDHVCSEEEFEEMHLMFLRHYKRTVLGITVPLAFPFEYTVTGQDRALWQIQALHRGLHDEALPSSTTLAVYAEREKFIDWTCNLIEEWGYHYE
ncbi:hypothetical protein NVP1015O_61 [Vibrio phage 1.015.O._10N.222.51.E5]|nr:hypothetical protein NVP1015O_61 [Vibrio phage 1.015.O._10N.222.51.E5]